MKTYQHEKKADAHTNTKISDHKSAYLKQENPNQTEVNEMASKTNRVEVPAAKAAMDRFKTEVASELGVNLKEGYNGDLISKEAGSIGGEMVRRMIKKQEEQMK